MKDLQLSSGDDGGCSEMLGAGAGGNVYGSYRGFYLGGDEQMPSAHKRKLLKKTRNKGGPSMPPPQHPQQSAATREWTNTNTRTSKRVQLQTHQTQYNHKAYSFITTHPQLLAAAQAANGSGERVVNSGEELDDIFVGHA